jgi:hypothetical protein
MRKNVLSDDQANPFRGEMHVCNHFLGGGGGGEEFVLLWGDVSRLQHFSGMSQRSILRRGWMKCEQSREG